MPFEVGQRIKIPMVYDALLNTGIKARYLFHILFAFKRYTWFGCEPLTAILCLSFFIISHVLVEVAFYAPLGCLLELGVVQLNGRQLAVSG